MAPDIYCKLSVKMAIIDKEEMILRDFLIFDLEIFK